MLLYVLKKAISQCAGKVIIIHAVTVLIGIYTRAIIYTCPPGVSDCFVTNGTVYIAHQIELGL